MISTIVDLETTGLSATDDRIVEIAIITTHDNFASASAALSTLLNPGFAFDNSTNGLSTPDVIDAPAFGDIIPILLPLLVAADEHIAYNANFDLGFLRESLHREGFTLPQRLRFDPMSHFGRVKLREAARLAHIDTDDIQWHRAMDDARVTFRIMHHLRKKSSSYPSSAASSRGWGFGVRLS